jgi:uncharacterized protein (UPF0333 family)
VDNRAQISVEYLTILAIGLLLSAILIMLVFNLFTLKDGLVETLQSLRQRILQV